MLQSAVQQCDGPDDGPPRGACDNSSVHGRAARRRSSQAVRRTGGTSEFRPTEGRIERLPELAADLARQNCDVVLVPARKRDLSRSSRRSGDTPIVIVANDYDVVLLDVMMPKLDGVAVVDQLRKENSPVLAHTYLLTAGDFPAVDDLPVRGLIEKPFDIHRLLAETKDCIGH